MNTTDKIMALAIDYADWQAAEGFSHPATTEARQALRAELKALMQNAYYEGFMASGEGWNGEYPFQDGSKDPRLDGYWCQTRDNAIEALKGKQ